MWQVMQDLCNWPLELTVLTAMGKMVSEVFPKSPGYLGQLEGVLVKAWWECLLVWTYLGYPEGSGGQACSQEQQHPLPPSLPCFGVCSGNFGGMSDGLMLLPGNPSLCWYPLWPAAFPLIFVLLVLLWLGSDAGGCSSLTGRQWKADLGCVCRLVAAHELKQQSDPVTALSHILLTCFAWPTLFLSLCSSPGLFYIDKLTIFSPSLSLPCLLCEDSQPECLLKVGNRRHFSVFRA